MTTIFLLFIIALITAMICTRLSIPLAIRLGILDQPDGYRKTHEHPVPRFGGPAIFTAFFVPIILLLYNAHRSFVASVLVEQPRQLTGVFVGASMALVLGLIDDRYDIRPRWKLVWQILIGLVACMFGFGITVISNPFGNPIVLGVFSWPVTIFWFVACMNAVNLADGMDGLAAGICLFVSLTLFFLSLELTNVLGLAMMACLAGSILGFLVFNFPPARIFLGDSGSMLLGFLVAALSLIASKKAEAALALFIPIVALGLPIIDTFLAIVRRWYHDLPLSSPDREHIHHMLVTMGFSRRRAVLILYGFCLLLSVAALVMTIGHGEVVILVIVFLLLIVYTSLRVFARVTFRDILNKSLQNEDDRRRSMIALLATNRTLSRMAETVSLDQLWQECYPLFEVLELAYARLELCSQGQDRKNIVWEWRAAGAESIVPDIMGKMDICKGDRRADQWLGRMALIHEDKYLGEFLVCRLAEQNPMLAETSELISRLRQKMVLEIIRLESTASKN